MTAKALASILLLALVVTLVRAADHPVTKYCIESNEQEAQIRALMLQALDEAFKGHQSTLFDVWLKEQAEEPERATNGTNLAIDAYLRAQKSIVNWKPQRCLK